MALLARTCSACSKHGMILPSPVLCCHWSRKYSSTRTNVTCTKSYEQRLPSASSNELNKGVASPKKYFELEVTQVWARDWQQFEKLTSEKMRRRLDMSRCNISLFPTEIDISRNAEIERSVDVCNIWEYTSLDDRAMVRRLLQQDEEWMDGYVRPISQYVPSHSLSSLRPVPGFFPKEDLTKNNTFGLRRVECLPGKCLTYISLLRKYHSTSPEYYRPLAVWITDVGQLECVVELYSYPNSATGSMHNKVLETELPSGRGIVFNSFSVTKIRAPFSQWSPY